MRYFVIASDGSRYGPADIATLQQWINEERITTATMLENEVGGQRVPVTSIPQLSFGQSSNPISQAPSGSKTSKISCPHCGQQIYPTEVICPFCSNALNKTPNPQPMGAPLVTPSRTGDNYVPVRATQVPLDFREQVLGMPFWILLLAVLGTGIFIGLLTLFLPSKEDVNTAAQLGKLGGMAILVMAIAWVFYWFIYTGVLWLGVFIVGLIGGDPFPDGFLAGYRSFLAITMVMLLVEAVGLLAQLALGSPFLNLGLRLVNILILRYFAEMDWWGIIVLNFLLYILGCGIGAVI